MRHGFVKVAAATPDIRVADVEYNTEQICRAIDQAYEKGAKIVAFPELCEQDIHAEIFLRRTFC